VPSRPPTRNLTIASAPKSKPAITHIRRQYAVGQGCFHAGFVGEGKANSMGDKGVRYVYDCGSLDKVALAKAIGRYHLETASAPIDFLFLSHLHADHIIGVKDLCSVGVDTIVLPHFNVIDRLISFAHSIQTMGAGASQADVQFLADLAVDPETAIANTLRPRQLIIVRRGEGDAPTDGGEPLFDGPSDQGGERRGEFKWTIVGSSRLVTGLGAVTTQLEETTVFQIADDAGVAIQAGAPERQWLLAPYVDEEVSLARDTFIKAAADGLGLTVEVFEAKALETNWLLDLVTNKQDVLVAAYGGKSALNVTSLCLYSGTPHPDPGLTSAKFGRFGFSEHLAFDLGWLGTGDADLKKAARLDAFIKHYKQQVPLVRSLLLPHHGAAANFHPDLIKAVEPMIVVAAAKSAKYRHPSTEAINGVAKFGLPLWNVTDEEASEVWETIKLE